MKISKSSSPFSSPPASPPRAPRARRSASPPAASVSAPETAPPAPAPKPRTPRAKKAPPLTASSAHEDVARVVDLQYETTPKAKGALAKFGVKLPKRPPATQAENPKGQLRRVVAQYEALTDEIKATKQRTGDYVMTGEDGEVTEIRPSPLSEEQKEIFRKVGEALERGKKSLEPEMRRLMKAFPAYELFLEKVRGCGTITAAKLLADIDITRCAKVSGLHRVCGMAVRVDGEGKGHAQRAQAGITLDFHNRLKVGLYQMFSSLTKDAKREESPYWQRLIGYKHRMLTGGRYDEATNTFDGRKGGRAIINDMSYRPAAQLFLEDLYLVWRAVEGLPVWPSYHAGKMGHVHEGRIVVKDASLITVGQALEIVGMVPAVGAS